MIYTFKDVVCWISAWIDAGKITSFTGELPIFTLKWQSRSLLYLPLIWDGHNTWPWAEHGMGWTAPKWVLQETLVLYQCGEYEYNLWVLQLLCSPLSLPDLGCGFPSCHMSTVCKFYHCITVHYHYLILAVNLRMLRILKNGSEWEL